MIVTLEVIGNLSKTDKQGNVKSNKQIKYQKQFDTNSILVEHHITSKGLVSKKWCTIREGDNYYIINKKFEEVKKLNEPVKVNGFKNP